MPFVFSSGDDVLHNKCDSPVYHAKLNPHVQMGQNLQTCHCERCKTIGKSNTLGFYRILEISLAKTHTKSHKKTCAGGNIRESLGTKIPFQDRF